MCNEENLSLPAIFKKTGTQILIKLGFKVKDLAEVSIVIQH